MEKHIQIKDDKTLQHAMIFGPGIIFSCIIIVVIFIITLRLFPNDGVIKTVFALSAFLGIISVLSVIYSIFFSIYSLFKLEERGDKFTSLFLAAISIFVGLPFAYTVILVAYIYFFQDGKV